MSSASVRSPNGERASELPSFPIETEQVLQKMKSFSENEEEEEEGRCKWPAALLASLSLSLSLFLSILLLPPIIILSLWQLFIRCPSPSH